MVKGLAALVVFAAVSTQSSGTQHGFNGSIADHAEASTSNSQRVQKTRNMHLDVLAASKAEVLLSTLVGVNDTCLEEFENALGANFPTEHKEAFERAIKLNGLKLDVDENSARNKLRHCIYQRHVKQITDLNKRKGSKATFAPNKFHVLTPDELKHLFTGFKASSKITSSTLTAKAPLTQMKSSLPSSFSWVGTAIPKEVQNQGNCGSCWAFSAAETMMARNWIREKKAGLDPETPPQPLSVEQLLECDSHNLGCQGGDPASVWANPSSYAASHRITSETLLPYTSGGGYVDSCSGKVNNGMNGITAVGNVHVDSTADALVAAVQMNPVSIAIRASPTCFTSYKSGVLSNEDCSAELSNTGCQVDHAVVVVGYKDYGTNLAFQVKNSWGNSWGEDGYVWMSGDAVSGGCAKGLLNMFVRANYPESTAEDGAFPPNSGPSAKQPLAVLLGLAMLTFKFI